jgi:hypothetical protein
MRRLLAALLLAVVCDPVLAHPAIRWTRAKVVGLDFSLVDQVRIESYSCTKAGLVTVTLGTKDAVTPPLWYWRIRDGRLQLSDGDSIREEFTLLNIRDGFLTVRRHSGGIARFRYTFEREKT